MKFALFKHGASFEWTLGPNTRHFERAVIRAAPVNGRFVRAPDFAP